MRRLIIGVLIVLGACGSDGVSSPGSSAPVAVTVTAAEPTTTVTEPVTTDAATTTIEAECVNGASENRNVTDESYDRYRCVKGRWTFEKAVAVAAPTTTTDPSATADLVAISLVGDLVAGSNPELADGIIALIEPSPLDRVDVLSGFADNDGHINLVVSATSGYSTADYQQQATIEALGNLAELWGDTIEMFSKTSDKVQVGLDLTIDGNHYLIDGATMKAIASRQTAPADALALAIQ